MSNTHTNPNKAPKIISIHTRDGVVLDVAGIPKGFKVVITDVDDLREKTFTHADNVQ